MSEAETLTQTQQKVATREARKLPFADLETVQWVMGHDIVRGFFDFFVPKYQALRETTIIGWIIIIYELIIIYWWQFIYHLPWPPLIKKILAALDRLVVAILEAIESRLEWWWDKWSVRLMWLKESILNFLDNALTKIDSFLLKVQDLIISILSFFLKPILNFFNPTKPKDNDEGTPLRNMKKDEQESDLNDDEDTEFGEDYLSDASTDSRRILKGGPHGMSFGRQCTTAMAEGKFREAMYKRVKKELRVMRKNSVRLSYGIVTYAKQMVEPRMRPYADSFQASCQKWAREHEIQETMRPLQEEWNTSKPPLAKILSLVQALCVVCLAFLLRLAKGKKSRRTRSMRSESLRRRAMAVTNNSQLSLSPTALQQSSEPAPPSRPLGVPESLPQPALKEDDEYLDGSPAKDSALGSEDNRSEDNRSEDNRIEDNRIEDSRSDQQESDHTFSPIDEEHEYENDKYASRKADERNGPSAVTKGTTNSCVAKKDGQTSPKQKKGVTILTPQPTKDYRDHTSHPQRKTNKIK